MFEIKHRQEAATRQMAAWRSFFSASSNQIRRTRFEKLKYFAAPLCKSRNKNFSPFLIDFFQYNMYSCRTCLSNDCKKFWSSGFAGVFWTLRLFRQSSRGVEHDAED